MSGPEPVGLVLRALGFGAALGVSVQALVTWGVRTLQAGAVAAGPPSLASGPALLLLAGTFGGILGAGAATWTALGPLRNPWRQAMLALIAALGSLVLSLVTLPIDRALGRPGLLGLAALAGVAALRAGRRVFGRVGSRP